MRLAKSNPLGYASGLIFLIYTVWWILLRYGHLPSGLSSDAFSDTYGLIAVVGGVAGLLVARKWGGFKSLMGRSLMFFSLGLLAQALGQVVYSVYFFALDQDVPYPSLGDIGYFGSVLFYIYAIYCLAKVSGASISLKTLSNKLFAVIIPIGLLVASYFIFLQHYEYSNLLTALLDFGYPFGEAIYISLAILTFALSRKILGGIMRGRILLVLFALMVQYIADFLFLYRDSRGQWYAGGPDDYLYLLAYFVMTLALLSISRAYQEIRE